MKQNICIREVNENIRRINLDMPLTRSLRALNKFCKFRKKWEERYNLTNGEKIKKENAERERGYRKKNIEEYRRKERVYYRANREKICKKQKECNRRYNEKNPGAKKKYNKEYYQIHKEEYKKRSKERYTKKKIEKFK